MPNLEIPQKSIYRISLYARCLERLDENGHEMVSSSALAAAAGVKPSQLRRDLAYFGTFGTRGRGYPVEALRQAIHDGLGRAKLQPVIMVGAGNLGSALLRYDGFRKEGYEILAAFHPPGAKAREYPCYVYSRPWNQMPPAPAACSADSPRAASR